MNKKEIIEFVPIDGKLYISLENDNKSIDIMQKRIEKQKEVIEKAIEMINDYIPEEYVRSCNTGDGIGRYELDTESWQYKVYEILKRWNK